MLQASLRVANVASWASSVYLAAKWTQRILYMNVCIIYWHVEEGWHVEAMLTT